MIVRISNCHGNMLCTYMIYIKLVRCLTSKIQTKRQKAGCCPLILISPLFLLYHFHNTAFLIANSDSFPNKLCCQARLKIGITVDLLTPRDRPGKPVNILHSLFFPFSFFQTPGFSDFQSFYFSLSLPTYVQPFYFLKNILYVQLFNSSFFSLVLILSDDSSLSSLPTPRSHATTEP